MANAATIEIARTVRQSMAKEALTAPQAKLYSQRLRLDMGREGLASFSHYDVHRYLDEAALLIQCGLLERHSAPNSSWRLAIKRAAEILEWLSQPELRPDGSPLHLLSAAAYQVADYPAMALGQLQLTPQGDSSRILCNFLRADFPATVAATHSYWRSFHGRVANDGVDDFGLSGQTYHHVVMCISSVCTFLQTGGEPPDRALSKMERLSRSIVDSRDPFSYMLAQLVALTCRRYVETSLWPQVRRLSENSSNVAKKALVQYARAAFLNKRLLVWPSQAIGIDKLADNDSFVLCTPTGSGKTTVATLAIVQNLFETGANEHPLLEVDGPANLVLYVVPTRALAAEVESRLNQDLRGISAEPTIVTGLYGGVDWGPTDAWIGVDQPTIVICTFEKADALVRYLGVLFLKRIRLVIIDEAHEVEQDRDRVSEFKDGSSRPFRLEQLGARLFRARSNFGFRVIGLSAVAASAAPALARWISSRRDSHPTTSSYRSTRQMLGRLEVAPSGEFAIRYDLMDGRSLKFEDGGVADSPYVSGAIPALPHGVDGGLGVEVRMRAPCLWAAIQLAADRHDGSKPSVLISITQDIQSFAATCADLMSNWDDNELPAYRRQNLDDPIWIQCLASAEDYFGVESAEYRLLQRGVAVHHGKMPGLLARRLKKVIDSGYARIIIATSTLSQGVNIPVNYMLLPSVCRGPVQLSVQEFNNLIGRAGRAGVATEGSALVVLPVRTRTPDALGRLRLTPSRQWNGYNNLVRQVREATAAAVEGEPLDRASSPIARLLSTLEEAWLEMSNGGTNEEFVEWLEQTAVVDKPEGLDVVYDYLESLDSFLISAIQEIEDLRGDEIEPQQMETELTTIWQQTYAFAAMRDEDRLAEIWLTRGRATKEIYPNANQRRMIYKSSLQPRSALALTDLTEGALQKFQDGVAYSEWDAGARFTFIRDILAMLSEVPAFRISATLGRRKDFEDWATILRWWLAKETAEEQPEPKKISTWYYFVSQNFVYKAAWGLGSLIGLLFDSADENEPVRALEIADWPRSGLPWIAFWIKELVTWGTLDPVAAFLLARNQAVDRPEAEALARAYYENVSDDVDVAEVLDPRLIRDWVAAQGDVVPAPAQIADLNVDVMLVRPADEFVSPRLWVTPVEVGGDFVWVESAGYAVARSSIPVDWPEELSTFNFELNVVASIVVGAPYLEHAFGG